jgi:PAS domain S-box-containing protein
MGSDRERIAELEKEVADLRKYRGFVENAFDSIWVIDVEGHVRFVSSAFGKHGARPLEGPIGEANVFDLLHPDDVEMARAALRRAAAGALGDSVFVHVRHKGADGGWVESDGVIRNCIDDPDLRGLVVTGRVAGTRNPLQRALQDSERRFRALFEATSVAVTLRDVARQRFIDCNAAALRLYGAKSREELLSSTPDTLAPAVQPDGTSSVAFLKNAAAIAVREGSFRGDWIARRLNGELFPAQVRISRIDLGDGPIFQTLIEDITDIKRNEELLARAKEDAERANRMKSSFLAAMTHELRTPLTGVVGMVDLLTSTPLDERQRRYAETARSSARMLMSVIDDILDLSKIEAGKLELASSAFSVRDVVDDVGSILALSAEQKALELVCSAEDVDGRFMGDGDRLRQVITNLVHNAIKFTSRGEVFVRAYAADDDGESVTLRVDVSDTGIGIPREDVERIFTPFTRLDSRERRSSGSGLGLTICRELVERMGGTIGFESTAGVGSTFFFTVKLRRAGDASIPSTRLRGRILVVAPSARSREVLVHHLTKLGCGVDTASDGATMQQRLATMPSDKVVVIVDDPRRGIDARAITTRLRDDPRHDDVRVVFVESIAHPIDEVERAELRIAATSCKPVWSRKLERAVRALSKESPTVSSPQRRVALPRRTARVLLVDDDAITSDVARGLLSASGYDDVVVARDGEEAVAAFTRDRFDAVLMDCRLPRVDGLEATRRIRAFEGSEARARTPVIALTAGVTTEELAACAEAGMNDHVAKPVDARKLIEVLERHLARSAPACDLAHGLDRLRGNRDLLEKLVQQFIDVAPSARDALDDAVTRRDRDALRYAAHRFRGQAATFDAHPLVATLAALETHAHAEDWPAARRTFEATERELTRLRDELGRAIARARTEGPRG